MSMALLILQWIGRILLVLLAIILVVLLLVLLVPIRYAGDLAVEDPSPHELAEWERVLHSARGRFRASWLGPVVQFTVEWQDALQMDLQILFLHKDPMAMMNKDEKEPESEETSEKGPQQTLGERFRSLYRKADYYKRVLAKEDTGYTLRKGKRVLLQTLRRILPRKWQLEGDVGLGDPANTAKVLEIHGMLIPLTAGHVEIRPVFMQYQMNGTASCKGRIRLVHLVIAALQLALDRRVMRTVRRIRNADRNIEQHYRQSAVNGG